MSGRRAFTLLELLLAMALNLVLLAAIATATFVFLRGFQRADREVIEAQRARAVFSRMGQDLRELVDEPPVRSDDAPPKDGLAAGGRQAAVLRGSRSELQLLIRNDEPPTDQPAAPLGGEEPDGEMAPAAWQVDYVLAQAYADAAASETQPSGLTRQRRRWSGEALPAATPRSASTATPEEPGARPRASRDYLRVGQIVDLRMRYYDGAEWRDDWDSSLDGLPRAVEVVLLFARPVRASALLADALPDEADLALPSGGYRIVMALHDAAPRPEDRP